MAVNYSEQYCKEGLVTALTLKLQIDHLQNNSLSENGGSPTQKKKKKKNVIRHFLLHCACAIPLLERGFEQERGWPLAAEVQVIVLTATTFEYFKFSQNKKSNDTAVNENNLKTPHMLFFYFCKNCLNNYFCIFTKL